LVGAIACTPAAPSTIPPGHQSAAGEERQAREHERAAGVLETQGTMNESQPSCGLQSKPSEICWTYHRAGAASIDLKLATDQRQAAEEHRRVSKALRDAEVVACAGVAEEDIVRSPFAHRDDIVDVQVIQGPSGVVGARVRFHELEKLTVEWLQHVVDCHLARDNALGHDVPEMAYCPLVPRGASATVLAMPHGYVIEVRSDDPAGAREIARRAAALMP
jgi:hypothetical protein